MGQKFIKFKSVAPNHTLWIFHNISIRFLRQIAYKHKLRAFTCFPIDLYPFGHIAQIKLEIIHIVKSAYFVKYVFRCFYFVFKVDCFDVEELRLTSLLKLHFKFRFRIFLTLSKNHIKLFIFRYFGCKQLRRICVIKKCYLFAEKYLFLLFRFNFVLFLPISGQNDGRNFA